MSNSDQPYFVEDGHIIYDAKPDDGALGNINSNVSSGSDGRNDSSASTSSERLPFARWSPATATSTENDNSSSNNQQVILLSISRDVSLINLIVNVNFRTFYRCFLTTGISVSYLPF